MAKNSARSHRKNNRFSQIPNSPIQRSVFDRSHDYKTTLDAGYLIPFFVDEVLPGDTFKLRVNAFVRMNTLVAPFMDNVFMDTFFFFVPSRLVWDNWQRFCGEQKNPGDSTDFLIPSLSGTNTFTNGSIFDYMGLPTGVALNPTNTPINALPFRAYNLIYNEWFRDENLIDSIPVTTGDGPDPISNYTLRKRAKRHDYFTSALPWPQKGPSVDVGLTGNAPVVGFDSQNSWRFSNSTDSLITDGWMLGAANISSSSDYIGASFNGSFELPNQARAWQNSSISAGSGFNRVVQQLDDTNSSGLTGLRATSGLSSTFVFADGSLSPDLRNGGIAPYVDLYGVSAITINDLRQAFQIQKFYEKWARGGSRYTETLRVMFNVISPDARLQRPEYLGGTHSRVNVVPTAQTSSTDSVSPQSNLSAFGVLGDGVSRRTGERSGDRRHLDRQGQPVGQARGDLSRRARQSAVHAQLPGQPSRRRLQRGHVRRLSLHREGGRAGAVPVRLRAVLHRLFVRRGEGGGRSQQGRQGQDLRRGEQRRRQVRQGDRTGIFEARFRAFGRAEYTPCRV